MDCEKPIYLKERGQHVPCGRCYPCLSNRRNQWTFRLQVEARYNNSVFFVTLTYADEYCDNNVHKSELQDFIKRFRKNTGIKIKYYAVGEYGTKSKRPHYHLIIFIKEAIDPDLMRKEVQIAWTPHGVSLGNTRVDIAGIARLHYITKYHITRSHWPKEVKNPPFTTMSTRPYIGSDYPEKMKNHHKNNLENMVCSSQGSTVSMPRIYKIKLYTDEERQKAFADLIEKRKEEDLNKTSKYWKKKLEYMRINPEITEEDYHDLEREMMWRNSNKIKQILKTEQL